MFFPAISSARTLGAVAASLLVLSACGGGGGAGVAAAGAAGVQALSAAGALGEQLFKDTGLSASGRLACSSCHDPARGHAAPNERPAQLGGLQGDRQGLRNAPGLNYAAASPAFHIEADGTPVGGLFWDGRADSLKAQAGGPLLNAAEMANPDIAAVVARVASAPYAGDFKRLYGSTVFDDAPAAFDRIVLALAAYQREDPDFAPFSSKYDAFLQGRAALADNERRGLALFNDAGKGNCAACHPSGRRPDGRPPLFTDFSYDALGVPRHPALAGNADPQAFDLGLCGRPELATRSELCGRFKVPSLRNVALRGAYFHNGRFSRLKDVVSFYVSRDTDPARWYPRRADGSVERFDDLPAALRGNVNTREAPYNRRPGDSPALNDAEVDDVVAFLRTLSDGYRP